MTDNLEQYRGYPEVAFPAGHIFITEGQHSGHLYILVEGAVEVFRGETSIAFVSDPGAIFGEMSLLLGIPPTASVKTMTPVRMRMIDDALRELEETPALLVPIARLLARRLQSSTTYLVDLKRQFSQHSDHFAMVDEVLESLMHQQAHRFTRDDELPASP
ncbi:MAG: Crp/Fnr family transcriptional regulator [Bauldia sp.]|nr:Crp/Fnr family transcriptional regulator [Bauldia sp.]